MPPLLHVIEGVDSCIAFHLGLPKGRLAISDTVLTPNSRVVSRLVGALTTT
jgi:hypothetical protein